MMGRGWWEEEGGNRRVGRGWWEEEGGKKMVGREGKNLATYPKKKVNILYFHLLTIKSTRVT